MHQSFDEYCISLTKMYLYLITNLDNGRQYVGQTNNLLWRWYQHKWEANHEPETVVGKAIKKYGENAFVFTPLLCCYGHEAANELERLLVVQYDSHVSCGGYNVEWGGRNASHTPETRAKISAGLREHYAEHESILKGVPMSDEAKKNMSMAAMGKAGTNTGKIFSEEWRSNMSKALSGSEVLAGRRFTPEEELNICMLYENGLSTDKLGRQFNCAKSLIIAILDRCKIKRRSNIATKNASMARRRFSDEVEKDVCDLFIAGTSRKEIAAKFKCGKTTIRDILLRNDIDLKRS